MTNILRSGDRHYDDDAVNDILGRVREYGTSFSERVQSIVLGLQTHPDLDCRFLAVRISFSDFYKTKRDQSQR